MIVIHHRNHFGVRSLNSYPTNQTISIDFTDPTTPTFGTEGQELINNKMVMIAGDANKDGQINPVDKNLYWRVENGQVYNYINTKSDFNLDGTVNPVDKNLYWRNNNSKVEQID